ncbi:hypothetical protein EYJ18_02985 [Salmonella enterica]|nr:hypothetical protein [Salmonella enterica subsp. enterica serovar Bere]EAT1224764.1 hypothetical protein [Salmonella enterica]EDT0676286.1 hypothetical protein [Salmonella enterica subsp. enterica]EEJ2511283.1 hypothetical protein [Salmonella enterica subsp. arizonae serovar 47:z4,z23:-]EAO6014236.1 hypothetical protein [Salmonella enterica subsp. enterica serovar Bere]
MKNIKSQGNGEQPAISRRHFIQASSALIALPFVSSPATAQARAVTATERKKSFRHAALLTAGANAIFGRMLVTVS